MFYDRSHSVLNEILDSLARCLVPEAARKLVELRADSDVQERVDALADKSTAGTLTAVEKDEYETYIAASTFIGILQSKARKTVGRL